MICVETGQLDFNVIHEYVKRPYCDYSETTKEIVNRTVFQQLWPAYNYGQTCERSYELNQSIYRRAYDYIRRTLYHEIGNYWVSSFCWTDSVVGSPLVSIFDSRDTSFQSQCAFCLGAALDQIPNKTYENNWMVSTYVRCRRALIDPRDPCQQRLVAIRMSGIKEGNNWEERCRKLGWSDKDPTQIFPVCRYLDTPFFNSCRRCFIECVAPILSTLNDEMWWRLQPFASTFFLSFQHVMPNCVWTIVLKYLR